MDLGKICFGNEWIYVAQEVIDFGTVIIQLQVL
jgi:hypothetical protein